MRSVFPLAARENLIPCAERGLRAVGIHGEGFVDARMCARLDTGHEGGCVFAEKVEFLDSHAFTLAGGEHLPQQGATFLQFKRDIQPRIDFLARVAAPGAICVVPCEDGVFVAPVDL